MTRKQELEVSLSTELESLKYTSTEDAVNKFDKLITNEDRNNFIFVIDFGKKTVFVIDKD